MSIIDNSRRYGEIQQNPRDLVLFTLLQPEKRILQLLSVARRRMNQISEGPARKENRQQPM